MHGRTVIMYIVFRKLINFFLGHPGKSLARQTLGVALAMGALTAGQAQAFVVNVGGQDWDVTTFTGSYNDNISKFALPTNGGVMPWWSSNSLAQEFMTQVGSSLGWPNKYFNGFNDRLRGPFFPYVANPPNPPTITENTITSWLWTNSDFYPPSKSSDYLNTNYSWAQATQVSTAPPAPGPLPALGAAAAFGFSRQLRKRIKRSNNAVSSSYSL